MKSNRKASHPLISACEEFITAAENDASDVSVFTFLRVNYDADIKLRGEPPRLIT